MRDIWIYSQGICMVRVLQLVKLIAADDSKMQQFLNDPSRDGVCAGKRFSRLSIVRRTRVYVGNNRVLRAPPSWFRREAGSGLAAMLLFSTSLPWYLVFIQPRGCRVLESIHFHKTQLKSELDDARSRSQFVVHPFLVSRSCVIR